LSTIRWQPSSEQLEIREQGRALADQALVREAEPGSWERLRLTLSGSPGRSDWTVRASQFVGSARLALDGRTLPLEIQPKLPADVFFLAERAFGTKERNAVVDRHLRADLAAIRRDPTACLIAWFLADVEAFALRYLRRGYEMRREVLEGGLRERLLLEEYVAGGLGEGRPQEVPCEFPTLTRDTPANRAIRATVQLALRRRRALTRPTARAALGRMGRRVLSLFAGVTAERLGSGSFGSLSRSPQPRHYRRVLAHCEAFASGLYMDLQLGAHERNAFLWDMNLLFQEALRGILADWPGAALERDRPRSTISDAAGSYSRRSKVDPDFVLRLPQGKWLLLDAKYKDAEVPLEQTTEVPVGNRRLRVSRADVYQAVAYRAHDRYRGAEVGLVFPLALEQGQEIPAPYLVSGFGNPVHLLFCDVGPQAEENLPQFFQALERVTR
jgi:5-methylcytosine-specific restriction enzyme subunit McrC